MPHEPAGDSKLKLRLYWSIAFLSAASAALLGYFALRGVPVTAGQNCQSYSLLGHRAFCDVLRAQGYRVTIQRRQLPRNTDFKSVCYLAPDEGKAASFLPYPLSMEIELLLREGATVCYVCRKWIEVEDSSRRGWIAGKMPVPLEEVQSALGGIETKVELSRLAQESLAVTCAGEEFEVEAEMVQVFSQGEGDILIDSAEGPLAIAMAKGRGTLILVSEPDLFANYALGRGDNCILALLLTEITAPQKEVAIDEVGHGFGQDPSFIEILSDFPAIFLTLQMLLFSGLALWAAATPFFTITGEPARERSREEQVKSVAHLTYATRRHYHLLRNYFACVLKELEARYPAITHLDTEGKIAYLDKVAREKQLPGTLAELYERARSGGSSKKIYQTFYRIYLWKEEVSYGQHS